MLQSRGSKRVGHDLVTEQQVLGVAGKLSSSPPIPTGPFRPKPVLSLHFKVTFS